MKGKRWMIAALGLIAAVLLAGGLALASGAGTSKGGGGATTMTQKEVAAQSARGRAGEAPKVAEAETEPVCDGDCAHCQNEECVRNMSEEQQLQNELQSCEGECDGDCAHCQNEECVRNMSEEQQLQNDFENCSGECDGDCLRTQSRQRNGGCGGTCDR